jgi:hypothetical protein
MRSARFTDLAARFGFHAGLNLDDFWRLEDHQLGKTTFTLFPDGTAHKNRMQGNEQLPRSAWLGKRRHDTPARQQYVLDLPRAKFTEWAARFDD